MIFVKNISLQFGEQVIFDDVSCAMQPQDRIGLVGRNGTGKSTFLKIIAGQESSDGGTIETQRGFKVAYMPQDVVIKSDKNVVDETMSVLQHLQELYEEQQLLEIAILNDPTEEQMLRYGDIEYELQEARFDGKKAQAQKILSGLGFDSVKLQQNVSQLSVGWRMRVVLAKLLLQEADFYLFDEPTNHLDITAKNWFLEFLQEGDFGYLLVCHDRYFLDKACSKTYELSQGTLTQYHGNYSYFVEQKRIREEYLAQAYEQQQREIRHTERLIDRFRASATKASMAQSLIKKLDKVERVELKTGPKTMQLKMHAPQKSGQYVLTVKNVAYGFTKQLFANVSFEIEREDKVALIAPNGTGKSTLFNLIAKKLDLQQGSINLGHNVAVALFDQDQEKVLDPNKTIFQEVIDACPSAQESQIRATLGSLLFSGDDIFKLTKVLSGGERNRVAMAKVILSKANFFLLDEPTNHLDIESKEIILQALKQYEGTILFVSHDQDFVNRLATKVAELTTSGIKLYAGNYDDYIAFKNATNQTATKKQQAATHVATEKPKQQLDFKQQKKIKNVGNKIQKLEQEITSLLEKSGNVSYGSSEYQTLMATIDDTKEQLKKYSAEWELLQRSTETE